MNYVTAIKTALFTFPLIAFFFTILHQYHKYGSIHKLRVCIIYSFILYMITTYFLVILPLPKMSEVTKPASEMVQLLPFSFIGDFIKETSLVISNPSTYLKALKEPCFYTVVFNILMTIPFGMYLSYYFQCNFKRVVLFSFFLSLFFELTQLTGLYFIYPFPYRLFDVDDLLMNTIGGMLGYFLMMFLHKFLPTREKIDEESIRRGETVSGLRRITLFFLDLVLYTILLTLTQSFFSKFSTAVLFSFSLYFLIIPLLFNQKTLGSKFLNIRFFYPNHFVIRQTIRMLFYPIYYVWIPFHVLITYPFLTDILILTENEKILLFLGILTILFLFYFIHFLILIRNRTIYYDHFFQITYQSTIKEKKKMK